MLFVRMLVTGMGCDALFNGPDALNSFPAENLEALVQERHEQKHVWHEGHESVSETSEQANNRKTEPVVLVRLSVHCKIKKAFRMLVLCNGQFLNGSIVRPTVPIILRVSIVGFSC